MISRNLAGPTLGSIHNSARYPAWRRVSTRGSTNRLANTGFCTKWIINPPSLINEPYRGTSLDASHQIEHRNSNAFSGRMSYYVPKGRSLGDYRNQPACQQKRDALRLA